MIGVAYIVEIKKGYYLVTFLRIRFGHCSEQ